MRTGFFADDNFNGLGTIKFSNGDRYMPFSLRSIFNRAMLPLLLIRAFRYEGTWVNNEMVGLGRYICGTCGGIDIV